MKKLLAMVVVLISLTCIFSSCDTLSLTNKIDDVITVEDGYLVVNGVKTEYEVKTNDVITFDENGYLVVNGVKTDYKATDDKDDIVENECSHSERKENLIEATCENDGSYESVIYCIKCGLEFERTRVIVEKRLHIESDWMVDSQATCTEAGSRYKECTECGRVIDAEAIPAIGHNYVNGSCTNCGDVDHDYAPETPVYSQGLEYTIIDEKTCALTGRGTCKDLDIIIPENAPDGREVIQIGYNAFDNTEIQSIFIPQSIKYINDYAFFYCPKLNNITVDLHNESYTSIDGNLYSKDEKTLLKYAIGKTDENFVIPNSVTGIFYAPFNGCQFLTSVVISDSVTSIGQIAFANCTNLTSIIIPDSVDFIATGAFCGCSSLSSVIIGNGVQGIHADAFSSCPKLKFNEYENGKYLGNEANPYFALIDLATKDQSSYTLNDNVKIIASSVFSYNSNLTSIVIPKSITHIGDYTFNDCYNLKDVYYTGSAENWVTINFGSGNSNLTEAIIHCDHVVAGDSIYSQGLEYTSNGDGTCYVSGIGTCTDVDIVIPAVSPDGERVVGIGAHAFENCVNIISVVIPEGVTYISSADEGWAKSFYGCVNLEKIVIPDSVTYIGAYAGESVFFDCNKLWEYENGVFYVDNWAITYDPSKITSLYQQTTNTAILEIREGTIGIANQAFPFGQYKAVVIPNSVKYIDRVAFWNWANAECVYYLGTADEWSKIFIEQDNAGVMDYPMYFYSETQPTTEGHFWHYIDDVPTVWGA